MRHKIFIISGVSGSGKGTVINGVLESGQFDLKRGMNVTTRDPKPRDKDEPHFIYVSKDEFKKMIKNGEIIEYNFYDNNYYGTDKISLKKSIVGHNVLMEADVNGALKIKQKIEGVVLIFIKVDLKQLGKRIRKRGQNSEEEIRRRLKTALVENRKAKAYDYQIENPEGHPEAAINKVLGIIKKELQR